MIRLIGYFFGIGAEIWDKDDPVAELATLIAAMQG